MHEQYLKPWDSLTSWEWVWVESARVQGMIPPSGSRHSQVKVRRKQQRVLWHRVQRGEGKTRSMWCPGTQVKKVSQGRTSNQRYLGHSQMRTESWPLVFTTQIFSVTLVRQFWWSDAVRSLFGESSGWMGGLELETGSWDNLFKEFCCSS